MKLISGERMISESDSKSLTLTTHRIRFKARAWGRANLISIMLEEVASCQAVYTSQPLFAVLSVLSICGGFLAGNAQPFNGQSYYAGGAFLGLLLFVGYLLSRRRVLIITAAKGTIAVRMTGDLEISEGFIDALEAAKHDRFMLLRQHSTAAAAG